MSRAWLMGILSMAVLVAGCGGSNGSAPLPPTPPPAAIKNATNASMEAIDCKRELAYVPLPTTVGTDAEVAVLDLSVDPDTSNPTVTVIDLGHFGVAIGAAIAPQQGVALVTSGWVFDTGFLDEIDEDNNTLVPGSPFSFPTGGSPAPQDGIVFDSIHNSALVSMSSSPVTCPGGSFTDCSGMATFDLASNTFGPLMHFGSSVNNFGLDPHAQISLASSDPVDPIPYALNLSDNAVCTLTDDSLVSLNGDEEGEAVDPATGIWVTGNFIDVRTSVVNLSGATFSGMPPSCALDEAGTPPSNSLNFNSGANDFLPGVTINPVTHEALLSGLLDNEIVLLSLPKSRVQYIGPYDLDAVYTSLPLEPDGLQFRASITPYSDAIDTCHNRAYIVNASQTFMAEIDLDKFRKDPGAISTALPAGNCVGTATTLGCDNHNGVRFFPLPAV